MFCETYNMVPPGDPYVGIETCRRLKNDKLSTTIIARELARKYFLYMLITAYPSTCL
jgi:hypothetical protein